MNEQMNEQMNERTNKQTNKQTKEVKVSSVHNTYTFNLISLLFKHRLEA
jgi:hypothetical protein